MEPFYDPYHAINPFLYQPPMTKKINLVESLKSINLSSTLKTCQKTVYTISQILPIVSQVKPLYDNAKTAFRVIHVLKTMDDVSQEIDLEVDPNTVSSPQREVEVIQENDADTSILFENML